MREGSESVCEVALTGDFVSGGKLLYKNIGLSIFDAVEGIHYRFLEKPEPILSPDHLQGVDALICLSPRVTAETLARAVRLVAITRFGVGYDTVDVEACTEADVALFITKGAVNYSVAEAILGWMLALSHHVLQKDRLTREGKWSEKGKWMGSELRRKTVGIIGLGGIGSALVKLLSPFAVAEVIAFDPYVKPADGISAGSRLVELAELLRCSDHVLVTCPLNDETRGLLGSAELALMKQSAYLVNAARGGIVDEEALLEALRLKRIAGAAIDVFATEPVTQHPFFELENVILAPHCIAWTDELFEEIGSMCCRQVVSLVNGSIPEGLVNKEVCQRPGFIRKWRYLVERRSGIRA